MDDDVVAGCLKTGNPRREECATAVLVVLRVLALRILASQREIIDEDEIVQHACVALTNRIERELNGKPNAEKAKYAHLPVNSQDFERIAYKFLLNALRDCLRAERRHRKNRTSVELLTNVAAGRPEDPLDEGEARAEIEQLLNEVYEQCSRSERRVIKTLVENNYNRAKTAAALGIDRSYISQILARLHKRCAGTTHARHRLLAADSTCGRSTDTDVEDDADPCHAVVIPQPLSGAE